MARKISQGKRIRYKKQDHFMVSGLFSNGEDLVRIILDTREMTFKIIDAHTEFILEQGGDVTNLEVLQRKAKRHLKKLLDIRLEKETRKVKDNA